MPNDAPPYIRAAHSSARRRRTARLIAELRRTRPLTAEQRTALLVETLRIPVIDEAAR